MIRSLILIVISMLSDTLLASAQTDPVEIARSNLAASIATFAEKQQQCDDQSAVLSPGPIKALGLSEQQLKDVLTYHFLKASVECTHAEAAEAIVNARLFKDLQPLMMQHEEDGSSLFTMEMVKLLKLEAQYNALPNAQRKSIDAIEALHKPFRLIESAEALGL